MKANATGTLGDTNHCVLVTIRVTEMDLAAGAVHFVGSESSIEGEIVYAEMRNVY